MAIKEAGYKLANPKTPILFFHHKQDTSDRSNIAKLVAMLHDNNIDKNIAVCVCYCKNAAHIVCVHDLTAVCKSVIVCELSDELIDKLMMSVSTNKNY